MAIFELRTVQLCFYLFNYILKNKKIFVDHEKYSFAETSINRINILFPDTIDNLLLLNLGVDVHYRKCIFP